MRERRHTRVTDLTDMYNRTFMEQCSAFFLRDHYFRQRNKLHKKCCLRHTRVTELKVEQLTLLDNDIFTENICTFDDRKVKKGLTSYATLFHGIQELPN